MEKNLISPTQDDELSLLSLIVRLKSQKIVLLLTTIIFILGSYVYIAVSPNKSNLLALVNNPSTSSILLLNKNSDALTGLDRSEVLYNRFLTTLNSKGFQRKVYFDNGFYNEIYPEGSFSDLIVYDLSPLILIKSMEIVDNSVVTEKRMNLPYSISINDFNSEFRDNYLKFINKLISSAEIAVLKEYSDNFYFLLNSEKKIIIEAKKTFIENKNKIRKSLATQKTIDNLIQLKVINSKIDNLRFIAEQERLNILVILNNDLKIAKSTGTLENNFLGYKSTSMPFPNWYFTGSKALNEEIELLENRTSNDPYISSLSDHIVQVKLLNNDHLLFDLKNRNIDDSFISQETIKFNNRLMKLDLLSAEFSESAVSSMSLYQSPSIIPINKKEALILLIGAITGFILSIIIAILRDSFNNIRKESM